MRLLILAVLWAFLSAPFAIVAGGALRHPDAGNGARSSSVLTRGLPIATGALAAVVIIIGTAQVFPRLLERPDEAKPTALQLPSSPRQLPETAPGPEPFAAFGLDHPTTALPTAVGSTPDTGDFPAGLLATPPAIAGDPIVSQPEAQAESYEEPIAASDPDDEVATTPAANATAATGHPKPTDGPGEDRGFRRLRTRFSPRSRPNG